MKFYQERELINTFPTVGSSGKEGLSTHTVLYIGDELESIEKTLGFIF